MVTGHTARYGGVSYSWVGGATAFTVGDCENVIRRGAVRADDCLLITKGPAAEIAPGTVPPTIESEFAAPSPA